MQKGQGSLEYLIIIAAVLAIAGIVVLFLTGAFGGTQTTAKLSECKNAAAQCKSSHLLSPNDPCNICDSACTDAAGNDVVTGLPSDRSDTTSGVYLCSQGMPEQIFAGSGGPTVNSVATQEASTSTTAGKLRLEWTASSPAGLTKMEYTAQKTGGTPFGTTCTITSTTVTCDTVLFTASTCSVTNGGKSATCYWEGTPSAFGEFTYTAKVTDANGKTAMDSAVIDVKDKTGTTTQSSLSVAGSASQRTISSGTYTVDVVGTATVSGTTLSWIDIYIGTGTGTPTKQGSGTHTCTTSPCSFATSPTTSATTYTYYVQAASADGKSARDPASGTKTFTVSIPSSGTTGSYSFSPNPATASQGSTGSLSATDSDGIKKAEFFSATTQTGTPVSSGSCTVSGSSVSCSLSSFYKNPSCTLSNGGTSISCTHGLQGPAAGNTYYYSAKVTDQANNVWTSSSVALQFT